MPRSLSVSNFRGARVPRVLGLALASAGALGTIVMAVWPDPDAHPDAAGWAAVSGCGLVFAAGLIDDLAPIGPRGLRNHARALAGGHVTTGILKLLIAVGAAVIVVAVRDRGSGIERIAAVALVAGSTNVWNGLDFRPGRALKAFLPLAAAVLATGPWRSVPPLPLMTVAAVPALALDLREQAMLGDAGSNLVGFAAGVGLAFRLSSGALLAAAGVAVGLNVLAETVTFSRVIQAVPALRWIDRLGRIPE